MSTSEIMTQTEARMLARMLNAQTKMIHVAHTVPDGCWGGTEIGWAVTGPTVGLLVAEQAMMRVRLAMVARSRLRQAERAQDWQAQLGAVLDLDRLES
jgi:hypothetical protein